MLKSGVYAAPVFFTQKIRFINIACNFTLYYSQDDSNHRPADFLSEGCPQEITSIL